MLMTISPITQSLQARTFGLPAQFEGSFGFLHPAEGPVGAVIAPHWGYEGLCFHPMCRRLAADLAAAGLPSLRFDPPGSGHAADIADDADVFAAWTSAVAGAVARLRELSGARSVVLVGLGLGAAAAARAAETVDDIAGLALVAPWLSGTRALRELTAAGRLADAAMGLAPGVGAPPGGLAVAGFSLTASHRESLAALKIAPDRLARLPSTLIVARPEQAVACRAFAEALGTAARFAVFEGYEKAAFDPSNFVMPRETIELIVGWAREIARPLAAGAEGRPLAAPPRAALRIGEGAAAGAVNEEALRFGPQNALFGVLAAPVDSAPRAAAILLNAGRNRAIGWARGDVAEARRLARAGVVALRFDVAGVGDSAPRSNGEPLYDPIRAADVSEAIDLIEARYGAIPVALRGPCSGAFLGFAAAVADERVKGAALINAQRYIWNPRDDFDAVMRQPVHTVEVARQARDPQQIRRLLTGQISLGGLAARLARTVWRKTQAGLGRRGLGLTHEARLVAKGRRGFAALAARGAALKIIVSEGDRAIEELKLYFGTERAFALAHGPQALVRISSADHNLTAPSARMAASVAVDELIMEITAGDV